MSLIDQYRHQHLGFIECPSSYQIMYNNPTRKIAIYELLEDVADDETDFDGKTGDIIIGGGRGEAPAFRIATTRAVKFFTDEDFDGFETYDELFKSFWTPTQAFVLCEGFLKLGWTVDTPIEFWLAENICFLLISNIEKFYLPGSENKFDSKLQFTEV